MNMIVSSQILRIKISLTACFARLTQTCIAWLRSVASHSSSRHGGSTLQTIGGSNCCKTIMFLILPNCLTPTSCKIVQTPLRGVLGPDTYTVATDIIAKLTKLDTKLTHVPIQKEGRGALHIFNMAAVAKLIRSVLSETLLASSLFRMLVSLENSQTQPY